jgi:hypothetical protein
VRLQDLQRLPGERVLDAEHQACAQTGQGGPSGPAAVLPDLYRHEGQSGDDGGRRPVRERPDRQANGLGRPGQRQQGHPGDEDQGAARLGPSYGLFGQRHGQQQREQQVRGQQRLDQGELEAADRPGGEQLPGHHAHDPGQPPGLAYQVGDDTQAEEPGLGLVLGRVLLKNEAHPEQDGRYQSGCVVHIQAHGALPY